MEWIKTSDRLPEENELVLGWNIWLENGWMPIVREEDDLISVMDRSKVTYDISHWCIPSPPKQD